MERNFVLGSFIVFFVPVIENEEEFCIRVLSIFFFVFHAKLDQVPKVFCVSLKISNFVFHLIKRSVLCNPIGVFNCPLTVSGASCFNSRKKNFTVEENRFKVFDFLSNFERVKRASRLIIDGYLSIISKKFQP